MASLAKVTKRKRHMRKAKMGRARKARLRAEGSTPAFPIHPEK